AKTVTILFAQKVLSCFFNSEFSMFNAYYSVKVPLTLPLEKKPRLHGGSRWRCGAKIQEVNQHAKTQVRKPYKNALKRYQRNTEEF
ncbi:MAG: hypothetical protein M1490_02975, partial [Candidatus Bathyarchaeota archaeon]|nr:hypothetical protein [Candidatus Bathyarchaeota archaeon]